MKTLMIVVAAVLATAMAKDCVRQTDCGVGECCKLRRPKEGDKGQQKLCVPLQDKGELCRKECNSFDCLFDCTCKAPYECKRVKRNNSKYGEDECVEPSATMDNDL